MCGIVLVVEVHGHFVVFNVIHRSIKGCLDALAKVEQVLNPEKHFTVEEKIFYKDCK
jgi:hypothetical protein